MRESVHLLVVGVMIAVAPTIGAQSIIHVPGDYPHIQDAIGAAADGDTVLVAAGTYSGTGNHNLRFFGKAITLISEDGPDHTIIDCQEGSRAFQIIDGETNSTVIDGFTILDGRVSGSDDGGGAYIQNSTPVFRNCIFQSCTSEHDGGAVGVQLGTSVTEMPLFSRCSFMANLAYEDGGAIHATGAIRVENCRFELNEANGTGGMPADGGALYVGNGTEVHGCQFIANNARRGGAIFGWSVDIRNCLFNGNLAAFSGVTLNRGGAIYLYDGTGTVRFITSVNNSALDEGDGIYMRDGDYSFFENILWDSADDSLVVAAGSATANYNDIRLSSGTYPGTGNINDAPIFATGPEGTFYQSQTSAGQSGTSPCVDAVPYLSSLYCRMGMGDVCMDQLTTRTDGGSDSGGVDLGYHYGLTAMFRDGFESNTLNRWSASMP
jgi:predicted outer membrane repeat protein